jgi:hypothetical protein
LILVATLIGYFITAGGIVVGADTAASNPMNGRNGTFTKMCEPGVGTVATLQGDYKFIRLQFCICPADEFLRYAALIDTFPDAASLNN